MADLLTSESADSAGIPGLRTTRQRLAVIAALAGSDEFKSAQEWCEVIRRQGGAVGLTTVYRAMQALVESGEVDVVFGDDGESKFRRCSSGHHHHLICRQCGKTVEIEAPQVERWARSVAAEHNFTAEQHTLEISGLCAECARPGLS